MARKFLGLAIRDRGAEDVFRKPFRLREDFRNGLLFRAVLRVCMRMCATGAVRTVSAAIAGTFSLFLSDHGGDGNADHHSRTGYDKNDFRNTHNSHAPFQSFTSACFLLRITMNAMTAAKAAPQINTVHHQVPTVYTIEATI